MFIQSETVPVWVLERLGIPLNHSWPFRVFNWEHRKIYVGSLRDLGRIKLRGMATVSLTQWHLDRMAWNEEFLAVWDLPDTYGMEATVQKGRWLQELLGEEESERRLRSRVGIIKVIVLQRRTVVWGLMTSNCPGRFYRIHKAGRL